MSKREKQTTFVRDLHIIDPESGFCTKCGLHAEMIKMDDALCMYSENTVSISHVRWHQRRCIEDDKTKSLAQTLDHIIKQLRDMEEKERAGREKHKPDSTA